MIVHSKTLAELVEIMVLGHGERLVIAGWFFWVEAVLVSVLGLFWFYRLTISLALYDPLFIIPLMQACFILFGGIAGGIFFQEFRSLPNGYAGAGGWALYILGFGFVLIGLYLVRTDTDEVAGGKQERPRTGGDGSASLDGTLPELMDSPTGSFSAASAADASGAAHDAAQVKTRVEPVHGLENGNSYGVNYDQDARGSRPPTTSSDSSKSSGGASAAAASHHPLVVEEVTPSTSPPLEATPAEPAPLPGKRMSGDGSIAVGDVNNWN